MLYKKKKKHCEVTIICSYTFIDVETGLGLCSAKTESQI